MTKFCISLHSKLFLSYYEYTSIRKSEVEKIQTQTYFTVNLDNVFPAQILQ